MKPDYVLPVQSTGSSGQARVKARQACTQPEAFGMAFSDAISKRVSRSGSAGVEPLMNDKTRPPGSLESSYRLFAGSFEPRRDPPGRTPSVEINARMLRDAEADPDHAWQAVERCVYASFAGPLLDITDPDNIRYSATGELVTPQSVAYYSKTAAIVKKELAGLYQHEKSLGTPPAQILKKVFCFLETQPRAFLEMSAW